LINNLAAQDHIERVTKIGVSVWLSLPARTGEDWADFGMQVLAFEAAAAKFGWWRP
jgi:hypothetical protein